MPPWLPSAAASQPDLGTGGAAASVSRLPALGMSLKATEVLLEREDAACAPCEHQGCEAGSARV